MTKIQNLIGERWESYFKSSFPGFVDTTHDSRVPDFYHPDGKFWVETKVGNYRWGPRIHEYQLDQFKSLDGGVVYALGFHDFDDAHKRLQGRTEERQRRILRDKMGIRGVVFINLGVIESVWSRDSRKSKKRGEEYMTFKPSVVLNIVRNRTFRRFGEKISLPSDYYSFVESDFLLIEPSLDGTFESVGTIPHREENSRVIDYLVREGKIRYKK